MAHTAPEAPQDRTAAKWARAPKRPLNHNPKAVRQARIARGLTQAALGEKIGRSGSYVYEIETGTRDARPDLLALIADALNSPVAPLERPRAKCPQVACRACGAHLDMPLHLRDDDTFCDAGQAAA